MSWAYIAGGMGLDLSDRVRRVFEKPTAGLGRDLAMGTPRAVVSSVRTQHPQAQQFNTCTPVHLPLQELQAIDVPFSLTVALGQ